MIITRTPFRISFVGGGSDLPSFYERHEGCVVSTSIDKYMYVSVHPTFDRKETIIKYNKTEIVDSIEDIAHPIARQVLKDFGITGVEIVSTADIPAGTGLSSSSAYTVGLLHALYAFSGKFCSQERIAREACKVEIEELGEPIGKQDQFGTAVGGLKFIKFRTDGSVDVEPLIISKKTKRELENNLLLFYTGLKHSAGNILKEQNDSTKKEGDTFNNLIKMTRLAYDMRESLTAGRLDDFGMILNENWKLKKSLASGISCEIVDNYYQRAMAKGALGGKLLGAGGGGFLLLYCPKDRQNQLRSELSDLVEMPFSFDDGGTKVIYIGEKNWE